MGNERCRRAAITDNWLCRQRTLSVLHNFFAICRANGTYETVNVMKAFKGSKCTLRNVQTKADIPAHAIAREVNAVVMAFGDSIREKDGLPDEMHRLDLVNIESREDQVRLIKDWGRVEVWAEIGWGARPMRQTIALS